jgi:hypothetical protein
MTAVRFGVAACRGWTPSIYNNRVIVVLMWTVLYLPEAEIERGPASGRREGRSHQR